MAVLLDLLKRDTVPPISLIMARCFGFLAFKQLLDAGKTLCDILCAGDTAGVEGSHGQLGTRLADGLGRDDTDRLAHRDRLAVGQVGAVALVADAVLGTCS